MSRLPDIDSDSKASKDSKSDENESLSALSSHPAALFSQGRMSSLENMLMAQLGGLPVLLAKLVEYSNKDEKDEKIAIKNQEVAQKIWDLYGQQIADHFLLLVAQGKQNEAEEMVKIYPDLIFASGNVTDYSAPTFKNITAWEYALWALDSHMWNMLLKYIPQDQKPAAWKQLKNLEAQGITYTLPEKFINPESKAEEIRKKTIKESHYDFSPLIDALKMYVDHYDYWNVAQCVAHWCKKVGGAQQMVPVHVANEYCREDRSYDPTPQFDEKDLPRTLRFYNYETNSYMNWFPVSSSASTGLGVNFAIFRVRAATRARCAGRGRAECDGLSVSVDLAAVTALCKARHENLLLLTQQLQNSSPRRVTSPSACLVM
jgi:hypothetical protein